MTHRDDHAARRAYHDALARELAEVEALLAELGGVAAERDRLVAELAQVRAELAGEARRRAPVRLDALRIASRCDQRWEDMVGEGRGRACTRCLRPVFDLSSLTAAEAEALLARTGALPCVRLVRRPDGTVMTADCAPTRRRRLALRVAAGAAAGLVAAGWVAAGIAVTERGGGPDVDELEAHELETGVLDTPDGPRTDDEALRAARESGILGSPAVIPASGIDGDALD